MNGTPLYPIDEAPYYKAMAEAAFEYDAWVDSRRGKKQGITIYSRKQRDADANL